MLLSNARRREDPEAMRAAVEQVVDQIDVEIESLRTLIRELRPAALDELGPAPAIEELAARVAERHGIEVAASVALDGRRAPEVEVALYRITQEALTNAAKHAARERVSIEVSESGEAIHVAVSDDGGGFDPGASRWPASAWRGCASGSSCWAASWRSARRPAAPAWRPPCRYSSTRPCSSV